MNNRISSRISCINFRNLFAFFKELLGQIRYFSLLNYVEIQFCLSGPNLEQQLKVRFYFTTSGKKIKFLSQDRGHKIILLLACCFKTRQKSARKHQKARHLKDFYQENLGVNVQVKTSVSTLSKILIRFHSSPRTWAPHIESFQNSKEGVQRSPKSRLASCLLVHLFFSLMVWDIVVQVPHCIRMYRDRDNPFVRRFPTPFKNGGNRNLLTHRHKCRASFSEDLNSKQQILKLGVNILKNQHYQHLNSGTFMWTLWPLNTYFKIAICLPSACTCWNPKDL